MVRGSVDLVTVNEVHGWAYAGDRKGPVLVQAVLHHEIVGETTATIHRPDLAAAGLGDGNSGFVINLFRALDPLYLPFVVVKVNGGDAELPRSGMFGFQEFFAAHYALYPAAGRHRSLLGGLWTDRTDAGAVLRGKQAIGQVPLAAQGVLQSLVTVGHALIDMPLLAGEAAFRTALPDALGTVLDDPALMAPLQVILEDYPLVLQATWVTHSEGDFGQASLRNVTPSPAETLELVVPFGDSVSLDVVRDSHKLPEYTPDGKSRWLTGGLAILGGAGWLDRIAPSPGQIFLVGAGTLYRITVAAGAAALRLSVAPARNLPVSLLQSSAVEYIASGGARIVI